MGGVPALDGAVMRFTIPAKVLARVADRYGAPLDLRLQVETSCGDQPLCLEYRAADDGLPIRVDGDDRDWSGEPSVPDPGGELFAPLRMLDLTRLRVDHEARSLFLCLDTDMPGFGDPLPVSPDLSVFQTVAVLVEPVDEAYESPRRVTLFRGRPPAGAAAVPWAARGRTIEAALGRTGADGRLTADPRVLPVLQPAGQRSPATSSLMRDRRWSVALRPWSTRRSWTGMDRRSD